MFKKGDRVMISFEKSSALLNSDLGQYHKAIATVLEVNQEFRRANVRMFDGKIMSLNFNWIRKAPYSWRKL